MLANLVFGELVKGEGNTVHRRIIVSSIVYLEECLRFYFLLKIKIFKKLYHHIAKRSNDYVKSEMYMSIGEHL